jgi:hypothetical protein
MNMWAEKTARLETLGKEYVDALETLRRIYRSTGLKKERISDKHPPQSPHNN